MTQKLILLFSHKLTKVQIDDVRESLKITNIISLPDKIQQQWSNIPPDIMSFHKYLSNIRLWLSETAWPGDYLLVQGDFGATHYFVNWAFRNKIIPIYSTTKRIHKETALEDGSIKIQKSFRHQMFRKYYFGK